ncbi:MAG TPA: putative DNA binding domain-containing protein [Candidatus Aphodovivens excrementavium]|nr:putative DNA binding domain-containing protein [Candidatus Aphodovivens excrementavium]
MTFFDRLNAWRENNRLEFKLAQGGFPKSFWETYSAFANTNGGLIVLGVDETSEGSKATGVADADALVQDLWNGLNNPQKVSANLLLDSDISVESVDGATIVVVKVPRADRTQRPVYINNNLNAGTYRRNGEGDYHCTMEVIRSLVRDSYDGAIDKDIADGICLEALNGDSIRGYRNEFDLIRFNHPWSDLPDKEFLLRLGAIGRSGDDGQLHPTKAGLLMFGEAWRITDEFPNYFLDCRQVSEGRRWDNRITSDSGDWSGNVYDFSRRASRMLCEGLPVPFELDSSMRRIEDTPQHEAIREGLANALVHADYYGRTGIVAIQRRSTVEFSNPGCLRIPVEVVEGGGVSDPRNRTLMTMFNLIGTCEKAGSGFDLLRRAAQYAGTAQPTLEEFLEPDRTKLTLHIEMDGAKLAKRGRAGYAGYVADEAVKNGGNGGLLVGNSGNAGGKTETNVGETQGNVGNVGNFNVRDVKKDGLGVGNAGNRESANDSATTKQTGDTETAVLSYIKSDQRASAASIASRMGLSTRQIERVMKRLREAGLIERIGGTRGHWEVRD